MKDAEASEQSKLEIIGQFGVGFYSAYMVASKVEVTTKSPYSDKAYRFTSNGTDSYEIEELEPTFEGSEVKLYLRKDEGEENEYDRYLDQYEISDLVKKYSDYIRYPIKMEFEVEKQKKDEEGNNIENEYEKVLEVRTLNSMTPIWKKKKNEVTDEELNNFL